jgi:hypothetical protein
MHNIQSKQETDLLIFNIFEKLKIVLKNKKKRRKKPNQILIDINRNLLQTFKTTKQ